MENKIKKIDSILADSAKKLGLTIYLAPANFAGEKKKFFEALKERKKHNPQFCYQRPKTDFKEIEKKLKKAEIRNKSQLGVFFEKIRKSLILKSELIRSIGGKNFTEKSCQLYGEPSPKILNSAKKQLKNYNSLSGTKREKKTITSKKALKIFQKGIKKFNLDWEVREKNIVSKVKTGNGKRNLYIKEGANFGRSELKKLVIHEIETHIFRKENGALQPLKILSQTYPGVESTEEGIAVYNEMKADQNKERFKTVLLRSLAVSLAMKYSFFGVFKKLLEFEISLEEAFDISARVKRGLFDTSKLGGFTKDYLYFKGYLEVKNFVEKGGNIRKLYIGKISIKDLPVIEKIKGIKPPRYLPR